MTKDTFTKHYGEGGYTFAEAIKKKDAIDEAYGVFKPNAKWNQSQLNADSRGGYFLTIETK